jgi:hypothetical protein
MTGFVAATHLRGSTRALRALLTMTYSNARHPEERRSRVSKDALLMNQSDIRAIALARPEARERPHFDRPSFRVRDKGGWTKLDIGRMDTEKMTDLVRLAWKQVAPKTLIDLGSA